ncbi:hypothetical protein QWY77_01005 [Thalassotalea ponticola]|uniref:hypothetical protein n=1 Tax=Thalassotalea ponticola TaxID=1523392 RepID=UPI0025B5D5AC|nr:hypothetical protein [Thalassotalea ponticola]MDN3651364.1 hypothetical protein [Thalassotalea ponticola]
MNNSEYLIAKKQVVCKLNRSGIKANQLDAAEVDLLIAQRIDEKMKALNSELLHRTLGYVLVCGSRRREC